MLLHRVKRCFALPGKRFLYKCKRYRAANFELIILYVFRKQDASTASIIVNSTVEESVFCLALLIYILNF